MTDTARRTLFARFGLGGLPLFFLAVAIYSFIAQRAPRATAHAFLATLRAGRRTEALAAGTEDFRSAIATGYLNTDSHRNGLDAVEPALNTLAASRDATFTNFSLGFGHACMKGHLDLAAGRNDVYIELLREDGTWRVNAVSLVREIGFCVDDD